MLNIYLIRVVDSRHPLRHTFATFNQPLARNPPLYIFIHPSPPPHLHRPLPRAPNHGFPPNGRARLGSNRGRLPVLHSHLPRQVVSLDREGGSEGGREREGEGGTVTCALKPSETAALRAVPPLAVPPLAPGCSPPPCHRASEVRMERGCGYNGFVCSVCSGVGCRV